MSPTNRNFRRRLQAYSALGGAFLLTAPGAHSAVVPTDPADTTIGPGQTFDVDLDNNGTPEVQLRIASSQNAYGTPLNGAALTGSGGATFCYPFKMSSGAAIGTTGAFACTTGVTFHSLNYGSSSFGNWVPAPAIGYLGVRFDIGGQTHYGWIHLQGVSSTSITVTSWAYDDQPDTEINAGTVPVELQSFTIE